jgi:hypothetical protein
MTEWCRALAADENFVPALYRLGQAQIQLGHLDQAEELITKVCSQSQSHRSLGLKSIPVITI